MRQTQMIRKKFPKKKYSSAAAELSFFKISLRISDSLETGLAFYIPDKPASRYNVPVWISRFSDNSCRRKHTSARACAIPAASRAQYRFELHLF